MSDTLGAKTHHEASPGMTSSPSSQQQQSAPPPPPPAPSFIFRGHDAPIHSLEFFASNTFLATGDETGWICVWDIWKRRPVCKWHAHKTGSVLALKAIPIRRENNSSTPSHLTTHNAGGFKTAAQSPSRRGVGAGRKAKEMMTAQSQEKDRRVYIVSHGRDNEIHFWDINSVLQESVRRPSSIGIVNLSDSTGKGSTPVVPILSLPVNALNFCKMAILPINIEEVAVSLAISGQTTETTPPNDGAQGATSTTTAATTGTTPMRTGAGVLKRTHRHIYVAVPSPTTSSLIDVYDVTKPERTYAAVGPVETLAGSNFQSNSSAIPSGSDKKWGSAMSIKLFLSRMTSGDDGNTPSMDERALHMLVGYEDGSVTLFRDSPAASIDGAPATTNSTSTAKKGRRTMEVVWSTKYHREPVLAVDVSSKAGFAISCGSDNVLVKYNLSSSLQGTPEVLKVALKANGMADGKIRSDEKVIALAGWDGRIRLFSSKTLKPLAVLKYHREGLYCLGLADIEEQQVQQHHQDEVPSLKASSDGSVVAISTLTVPGTTTSTAAAITTGENDDSDGGSNDDRSSDESGSESDNDSDSGDDSELEDALADRQRWSTRHWIAVGGKEQRISLWDIY
ncbi:Guanine nucleotide binding protein (G protein), beta polypeptide 1-like [Linnemannia gamsii]|uniref:ASTRA-associated protein 1 n=1 Tax=Linnemannia gamsii TaxID=64522 RepID=A0ABQ7JXU4_9FUNG|nr:Guanine nucleotide binding protein (G protein), beta polypeptide 1-like [Linnemannia gamsii]